MKLPAVEGVGLVVEVKSEKLEFSTAMEMHLVVRTDSWETRELASQPWTIGKVIGQ